MSRLINDADSVILRGLAEKVHSIALEPEQEEKRELWRNHTSLKGNRPPIFVSPEGSWAEILPPGALKCEGAFAREAEAQLRRRIFRYEVIKDDTPIEDSYDIPVSSVPINPDWGLKPEFRAGTERGSWHHKPVIERASDWKKLKMPRLQVDAEGAAEKAAAIIEATKGLIKARKTGIKIFDFHIAHIYCDFRGLDNFLYDLTDEPEMVEDMFSFFEAGLSGLLDEAEKLGIIECNNDYTYHYTGGVGYTRDLPLNKQHAAYSEVWGAAEAQEYAVVSPSMFARTVLPHEKRLLSRFGLTGYGCCDDLTEKLDSVLTIHNLRRVAACPWANLEKMAGRLKKDYILTWKPNPAYLAAERFDAEAVSEYMYRSLSVAKCGYPEIILRDTHTCRNEPARFGEFVKITRNAINKVYGE